VHIGNPQLLASASDGFLRHAIRNGRPGTLMPAFHATLGDAAIDDVVALLRSWQTTAPTLAKHPHSTPAPLALGPVPLNPKGPEPVGFKTFPAATPAETVKKELDRHAKMAILDARAPSDYTNDHIAGAVSVPFYDPDPYIEALPKDAWLVCYCSCPHAESGQLAQKLVSKGFSKVTVLDEGLGFWRSKKYETRSGADP
jgi:cytochrome c oxidase cbb3-type subunit 3